LSPEPAENQAVTTVTRQLSLVLCGRNTMHKKVLATAGLLSVVASIAGFATFSAFSSTTANSGNSFEAGTVYISDNDSGSAMYSVTNKKPG
jgi:hypothetical protein